MEREACAPRSRSTTAASCAGASAPTCAAASAARTSAPGPSAALRPGAITLSLSAVAVSSVIVGLFRWRWRLGGRRRAGRPGRGRRLRNGRHRKGAQPGRGKRHDRHRGGKRERGGPAGPVSRQRIAFGRSGTRPPRSATYGPAAESATGLNARGLRGRAAPERRVASETRAGTSTARRKLRAPSSSGRIHGRGGRLRRGRASESRSGRERSAGDPARNDRRDGPLWTVTARRRSWVPPEKATACGRTTRTWAAARLDAPRRVPENRY